MKPVTPERAQSTRVDPPPVAMTERRLTETVDRRLEHPELARRVGVLAAIDVAESPQLRSRFGPEAEDVVTAVLKEIIARGDQLPEQHSPRSGGGFWILLPETGFYAADQRLRQLSLQAAESVVDVIGERLRVTPVIGYATFADATSARELCDQASMALHDASLHPDLVPVKYSRAIAFAATRPAGRRDRLMRLIKRFWSPLQIGFILSVLLDLPFIAYVLSWRAGFDLTSVSYPLLAASFVVATIAIWIASFRVAASSIENLGTVAPVAGPLPPDRVAPPATAIVAAHLPYESSTIVDTVTALLEHDYPGELQVILTYSTPEKLPIERSLDELTVRDPRLTLLRVEEGKSEAECVSAALPYVRGEFVGIFDADNHVGPGSFSRACRWFSDGYDIVQGHRVVRNGEVSWVTRLVAVDYEGTQAVADPGGAGLHGFGVFGGSNVYWRVGALREIGSQRLMPPKEIEMSRHSSQGGFAIASDPLLVSSELAPTTLRALWRQRIRWAQAQAQTVGRRTSRSGWMQTISWLSLQVFPILGFVVWRDGGFGKLDQLIPLFVLLAVFTLSMGVSQGAFAYLLADPRIKRHRTWFVSYAFHSAVWLGEFKDLTGRVARFNWTVGERRVVATDSEAVRQFLQRASNRVTETGQSRRIVG
jgi:cellulose synthase/poly-beta-1,6-N-acetylglucosamine synthase-like glycosyltransferase